MTAFYQLYDPRSECALTGLRTLYNLHYECKEEALRCLEAGHVAHVYRLLWRVWSTVDHMCSYLMTMAYMKCAREAQGTSTPPPCTHSVGCTVFLDL